MGFHLSTVAETRSDEAAGGREGQHEGGVPDCEIQLELGARLAGRQLDDAVAR